MAVYVSGRPAGNDQPEAPRHVNAADVAACAAKADKAKAVAASATGEVAAMLAADPPQSLKALAFTAPDGKPMTLADRAGKTVLLNLWATWCVPCREEMPALDRAAEGSGQRGLRGDRGQRRHGRRCQAEEVPRRNRHRHLGYYRDNTLALFNDLKKRGLALGLPVTLLIDADGCLLAHMNGPADWAGDDARRLIKAAGGS